MFGWYSLGSAGSCRLLWVRFQSFIFWEGPKWIGLSFRGCVLLMAGHQGADTTLYKLQKDSALHHNFSIQEMIAKDTCPTMGIFPYCDPPFHHF